MQCLCMTYNMSASDKQCRKFSYSTLAAIITKSIDVNFLVQISSDHSFCRAVMFYWNQWKLLGYQLEDKKKFSEEWVAARGDPKGSPWCTPHSATVYNTFFAKMRFDSIAVKDATLPCFVQAGGLKIETQKW